MIQCQSSQRTNRRWRLKRNSAWLLLIVLTALFSPITAIAAEPEKLTPEQVEFFEKEIRPILVENCQGCHGPEKQWASLRLDSRDGMLKGGDSGPALTLDALDTSELLLRIRSDDESTRMPPADAEKTLTAEQIATLTRWVQAGAPWPTAAVPAGKEVEERQRNHWAFQPLTHPAPPAVQQAAAVQNDVDRFIVAKLESQALAPAPRADRRVLIRRATAADLWSNCRRTARARASARRASRSWVVLSEIVRCSAATRPAWARSSLRAASAAAR